MKALFSTSLSRKKWVIMLASFIVFASAFGFLFYEISKKTVTLTLDGKEKVIETHSSTIQEIFDELDIAISSEDYVFPSLEKKITDDMKVVWKRAKQVELKKDDEEKTVWTTAGSVEEFLKEQKISLNEHDQVNHQMDTTIEQKMEIVVHIAFPVTLLDAGKKKQVWSTSTTVADFLTQQEISLAKLDRVEPNLKEKVKEKAVVNITRVEKVTDVVEQPIDYAVVTQKDHTLKAGTEKVVTEGKKGLVSKKFEVTKENGKEVSRKLLSEKNIKEKQDKLVAVGTKSDVVQIASRGESSRESADMYVNSTAYTASCNGCSGRTATGIDLKANPNAKVIAVDPSYIPLGTKVYVEGYGYAVAADTGGAIKGKKIDVFFPSKADAYRWGNKPVKIKIIQ
ncbi:G5 and 3D domain-containing protein [Niallia sp. NCCP-28]|uniref:G5 and 3D domain-containing protein n=1 Tax=Niallia sp. NCCP-28 TaxID=2934712 RepID=UPI0020BD804F|nr:G5 and 3D domain-containing protein [Niallia sp. NCCP-28]